MTPVNFVENEALLFACNSGTGTPAFTVTMNANHTVAGFFDGSLNPNPCPATIAGTGTLFLLANNLNACDPTDDNGTGDPGVIAINVVLAGPSTGGLCIENGAGYTYLNGANTYSGGTYLGFTGSSFASGTVYYNTSASFGSGPIYLMNSGGGALVAEGTAAITIPNNVVNYNYYPTYATGIPAQVNLVGTTGGATFSGNWIMSGGGGGTGATTVYATTAPLANYSSVTIKTVGTAGQSVIISGAISGTNTVIQTGTQPLYITPTAGANPFAGTFVVDGYSATAQVFLGNNNALPNATNLVIDAGGILDVSGADPFTLPSSTAKCSFGALGTGTTVGSTAATLNDSAAGGTISFGAQPINLTIVPTSPNGDSNHPALLITAGALSLGGNAFIVTNASPEPLGAGIYYLIQAATTITDAGGETVTVKGNGLAAGASATVQLDANGVNYDLVVTGGLPEPLFSNLTASQSKVYGTTAITLAGTVSYANGPVYPTVGDTVTVTIDGSVQSTTINDSTGDFSFTFNPDSPIHIPVTGSPWTIQYVYPTSVTLNAVTNTTTTLTITPAALSVTATATSVAYGTAAPYTGITTFSSSGLLNGETIGSVTMTGATGTGTYAGTNTPVAASAYKITPSAATGGTFAAANYTITYNALNNGLSVTPVALTVTASAESMNYGYTYPGFHTLETSNFTASGFKNGQTTASMTVTLTCPDGTPTTPVAVYTGAIVPSAAAQLSGKTNFSPGNYTITYANGTFTVSRVALSVTASPQAFTYGSVVTPVSGSTLFTASGFSNSETIGTVTLTFSTTNAGTGTITPSAATGGSGTENDYTITYHTGVLTVNPLVAVLTGTNFYNGTTNVTNSALVVSNVVGTDNVTVASGSGGMASADIGTNAITSLGNLALGGTKGTDYTLTGASGALVVVPLPVALTGSRPYDGTNDASSAILTITNEYSGDAGNLTLSGSGILAGSNAGTYNITDFTGFSLSGSAASNYTTTNATGSVTIGPADVGTPVIITANPVVKTYGTAITLDPTAFTVSGGALVGSETPTSVTMTATPNGTNQYDPAGIDTITPSAAIGTGGFLAANYSISYVTNSLTVQPYGVSLIGTRPYDGATDAAASILTVAGVLTPDIGNVTVDPTTGPGTLASTSVGSQGITALGTPALALIGTAAANYTLPAASPYGVVNITNPFNVISNTASVDATGTNLVVCWQSVPGVLYTVLTNGSLNPPITWTSAGTTNATGTSTCFTLPIITANTNVNVVVQQ